MTDVSGIVVSELIVPPPLSRMQTKKTPDNLALILSVCGDALHSCENQKVNASTVLLLLQKLIISVNKLTKLSKEDEKKLVLDSIEWIINNQKDLSDEDKQTLDILSETVFPQAFDLLSTSPSSCFPCLK